MSEIKGQLLGVLLVLAVFGAAITAATAIMSQTSTKVAEEIENFSVESPVDDGDFLTYYNN